MADAYYGVPLHIDLSASTESENLRFAGDLDATLARHPEIRPKYVTADKDYDSLDNFKHSAKRGIISIIAVRRPPKNKKTGKRLSDGTYAEDGRPVCVGGQPWA